MPIDRGDNGAIKGSTKVYATRAEGVPQTYDDSDLNDFLLQEEFGWR